MFRRRAAIKAPLEDLRLLHLLLSDMEQCIELDAMKAPLEKFRARFLFFSLFLFVRRTGEQVNLGDSERWLRPRGLDSDFL
jgi:hypothetical protein